MHRQLVALTTLAASLVSARVAPAVDLTVGQIIVNQAVQNDAHDVPLVAQRSTVIRAEVDVSGTDFSVSGVTGRVHVFVGGVEVTPPAGVPAINEPFSAPVSPNLSNEAHTLNFELPAPTGIGPSSNVDIRVDLAPIAGEDDPGNNSGSLDDLTFHLRRTPRIYFTRMNFVASGLGLPALSDVEPGVGDAFVRGIYPVNDGDPNLYQEGAFPTVTWNSDEDTAGVIDGQDVDDILTFLEACRQLIVEDDTGAGDCTFLYAWVAGNPINGNGWAPVGGRVAFGNTQHSRHQRTFAHELGHNFGLNHNSSSIGDIGWDVGARLDGNPAGNNTSGRIKVDTLNDIMRGGQLTNTAWVRESTYQHFFDHTCLQPRLIDFLPYLRRFVVVQGIFDPIRRRIVRVNPVFRYPWRSQASAFVRTDSALTIVAEDQQGNQYRVLANAELADDSGKEGEHQLGYFQAMVPVDERLEVDSLQIAGPDGDVQFRMTRSRAAPRVEIAWPRPRAELEREAQVQWEIFDEDTSRADVMVQVAYSPNGGKSFVPVVVNVPGTAKGVRFDATKLPASRGAGLIRVFVSDGLNTTWTDLEGLTWTPPVVDPEPRFGLDFRPLPQDRAYGPADEMVRQDVVATLTSSAPGPDGVQGWSIGVSSEGGRIVDVNTDGTRGADRAADAMGLRDGGFVKSELTVGAGNVGAVSVVVLSFTKGVTLPPAGTEPIARLVVEARAPASGECDEVALYFRDGLRGSGEPIDNLATYDNETWFPTQGKYTFGVCGTRSRWTTFDCNGDGLMNISDCICQLGFLFLGGPASPCQAAMDFNGDSRRDLSDPVAALSFMFLGGPPPDAGLGCQVYPSCPASAACN